MNMKQLAAACALDYVRNGMTLGLGSGSTMSCFLEMLGERLRCGELSGVTGVSSSENTTERAREVGIPLSTLDAHPRLDLAVDGADEVDPKRDLIKGKGRALLREKVIACHAAEFVVIVDETKLVPCLGTSAPLPVEISSFAPLAHVRWLKHLGCRAEILREDDDTLVVTDNGNHLVQCWFPDGIKQPYNLSRVLAERPGVLEHGMFLGMADRVVVGREKGVLVMGG